MPNSSRMMWPYPGQNQDPWYDSFESMVMAMDASSYANREDRNLVMAGGGVFTFTASTGVLIWSAAIEIFSTISGFKISIPAGTATLSDGQILYVNVTRAPTDNVNVSPLVSGSVPNTDDAYALLVRSGTYVYFRTGQRIGDGEEKSMFGSAIGAGGEKLISLAWTGSKTVHDSDTPLMVGAFAFNPLEYVLSGTTFQASFRAVCQNDVSPLTSNARLYNATDGWPVATLNFTTTSPTKDEVIVSVGALPGMMPAGERMYTVDVYLAAPPSGPSDAFTVYSIELRTINTIV